VRENAPGNAKLHAKQIAPEITGIISALERDGDRLDKPALDALRGVLLAFGIRIE